MTLSREFAPTKAVFYFRTRDRWPGGNADMITTKVVLRLSPGAAPELAAQYYRCFDGHAALPDRSALCAWQSSSRRPIVSRSTA